MEELFGKFISIIYKIATFCKCIRVSDEANFVDDLFKKSIIIKN